MLSEIEWRNTDFEIPGENQIVLVDGGVAQFRAGTFYTGMESPQYSRPIQWVVTHWALLPRVPRLQNSRP